METEANAMEHEAGVDSVPLIEAESHVARIRSEDLRIGSSRQYGNGSLGDRQRTLRRPIQDENGNGETSPNAAARMAARSNVVTISSSEVGPTLNGPRTIPRSILTTGQVS